ncbi:alpha/beta fold hydrolase [Carnobacterium pleistocenium]|uniref:alpha/beta fold hydrolase n=1 Tax=Carnobacterium pleistocenium TaxID=181073 RepID=UPI0005501812|nr:alpha/beta hydrolase [Carnobacterium pleistocenium]
MKKIIKGKNNASIAVEDLGEGQPIVFLHGWPFDHQMFDYQYDYFLPRGYRVIGIDFRGFGDSDLVIEEYGYDTFADDVKVVLEELQIEEAILVGFSMGGAVATRFFARHKGFGIKKLILVSAAVPQFAKRPAYSRGIKKSEITSIVEEIQLNRPKMIQDFIKKMFNEKTFVSYKNWLTSLALRASSYGMILSALAMRDENVQADLAQITVPTLICHGEKDVICSYEVVEEMTQLIPKNIVTPFRKSGHAIFHDETDKLNRTMLMFIQNKV